MDTIKIASERFTVKVFNSTKISDDDIVKVKELLRLAPSSTNLQGWHFFVVSSDEGRAKVVKSVESSYPFNQNSIEKASHVIVFCSKKDVDDEYFAKVLGKEEQDGRFLDNPEFKENMDKGRKMFANLNRKNPCGIAGWMAKQVYINLGMFLLGIEGLGIKGTPIEGFDSVVLDKELGLDELGLCSQVVVPIGYSDLEHDYNAKLPKSRLATSDVITDL